MGLTLQVPPGYSDLSDSTLVAGSPVFGLDLLKIYDNAVFGLVRPEIFITEQINGDTVPLPVSPIDGYTYQQSELTYMWGIRATYDQASGWITGKDSLWYFACYVDQLTGKVYMDTWYRRSGSHYDGVHTNDGQLIVYTIAQRQKTTLVMASSPSYSGITGSTVAQDKPLTQLMAQALNDDAKFAVVDHEVIYLGEYVNGQTVTLPVSPADGYHYSAAECAFQFSWRWTAPGASPMAAPSLSDGQLAPIKASVSSIGAVSTTIYYVDDSGNLISFNDGRIAVFAFCQRSGTPGTITPTANQFAEITFDDFMPGSPLPYTLIQQMIKNQQEAMLAVEFFGPTAYADGSTISLPTSPIDGYAYSRSELYYLYEWSDTTDQTGSHLRAALFYALVDQSLGTVQLVTWRLPPGGPYIDDNNSLCRINVLTVARRAAQTAAWAPPGPISPQSDYSTVTTDAAWYYQEVEQAGTAKPAEIVLNFLDPITATDDPTNQSTDIAVPDLVGDTGAGGAHGLVPAPGAGDAAAQKYLRADATWHVPDGPNVRQISGATTAAAWDYLVASSAGGPYNVALPSAAGNPNAVVAIKKVSLDSNAISMIPTGSDTVENAASFDVTDFNEALLFVSDGVSNWNIFAGYNPNFEILPQAYTISPRPTVYQGKSGGWSGIDTNSSTWTNVDDVYFPPVVATLADGTQLNYAARDSGLPAFGGASPLPNFFGMNITSAFPSVPVTLPVQSYRFWDNGCRWQLVNTASGVFTFTQVDFWIARMAALSITDCIFELGGTPQWCSSQPTNTGCDYAGSGTNGYGAPATDLNADGTGTDLNWRKWCKAIAQHFYANYPAVLVSGWCPWNEFTRQAGFPGSKSWLGTNAQMVRMAEDARAIILGRGSITATGESAAAAQATVGLSGPAYPVSGSYMLSPSTGASNSHGQHALWTSYQSTAGATAAAEVIAIHEEASLDGITSLAHVQGFQAILNSTNAAKPLWLTESSWLNNTPTPNGPTAITNWYTNLYGVVQRLYWYEYASGGSALANSSGTVNATGTAYQAVYTTLNGGGGGGFGQAWVTVYDPDQIGEPGGTATLPAYADLNQVRWTSPGYVRIGTLVGVSGGGASGGGGGSALAANDIWICVPTAAGTYAPNQELFYSIPPRNVTMPMGLIDTNAGCRVAPTANVSVVLLQNGVSIGTVNIAAGATIATFTFTSAITYNGTTDSFSVKAPATPDATFAGFFMNIWATRSN